MNTDKDHVALPLAEAPCGDEDRTAKERPILFSAPMVRALLTGTKTQTRRPLAGSLQPLDGYAPLRAEPRGQRWIWMAHIDRPTYAFALGSHFRCPYGHPGDRLWVRESWRADALLDGRPPRDIPQGAAIFYESGWQEVPFPSASGKLRPSIFMPRWASRILLEVADIRVQRLQDISEADAKAEGCVSDVEGDAADHYATLWDSINGDDSWKANPWVWAVSFRRLTA